MTLAFARGFSPFTRLTMPAVLTGGCTKARRTPARRQWLRVADRLAAGLSAAAAARAEGERGAELVQSLLAQEDFRELVEATRESFAEPPEVQRRQLVMLARQTLERAMAWDGDPRVALFVLEEDARGRDPAETLADGVEKARRRALATAAPPPAPEPAASPQPSRATTYDPLQAIMHRGAARLRDMVRIEGAIRLAARHGAAAAEVPTTTSGDDQATVASPPPVGVAATRSAASSALRLSREAAQAAGLVPLRNGLWAAPGSMQLVAIEAEPIEGGPRRAQGP